MLAFAIDPIYPWGWASASCRIPISAVARVLSRMPVLPVVSQTKPPKTWRHRILTLVIAEVSWVPLAVKAANEEELDTELVDTEVAIGRRRAGGAAEAASVEIADTELVDTEVAWCYPGTLSSQSWEKGLREVLYQAYRMRVFQKFASRLAIANLRICELLAPKKKDSQIRNSQFAIVQSWDTLLRLS